MTQPVAPQPVAPPTPPTFPTAPDGNFTNPAFLLGLVPTISFVLTLFFHKDFGLSANAAQWSVLATGLVAFGCYISRAVKHHANGAVLVAWLEYLASQMGSQHTTVVNGSTTVETTVPAIAAPVAPSDPNVAPVVADGGDSGADPTASSGASVLPRRGTVSTTRAAAAKKAAPRRGR